MPGDHSVARNRGRGPEPNTSLSHSLCSISRVPDPMGLYCCHQRWHFSLSVRHAPAASRECRTSRRAVRRPPPVPPATRPRRSHRRRAALSEGHRRPGAAGGAGRRPPLYLYPSTRQCRLSVGRDGARAAPDGYRQSIGCRHFPNNSERSSHVDVEQNGCECGHLAFVA